MNKNCKLKDKFIYWLDKQMSKGTVSMIKLLSFAVLFVVIFVSVLIVILKIRDDILSAFWDSLANVVNAWMPSSDDGQVGYIILNTLTAIIGLLFTSILIGIVSSGIEEKIQDLRKGNSKVLEKDHTVILGYNLGEHGLLKQLILASENKRRCFVIFTETEKIALEEDLKNNVDIPNNITVICRNGDITNINDLYCCSIDKARNVIINALNDNKRVKSLLAVSLLKKEFPDCNIEVVACVSDDKYMFPEYKMVKENIIMFKTNDIMAKIIAHTSTEPGLSQAFKELLNFEGYELYFEKDDRLINKSVVEIASCLSQATLVGIKRNDEIILNPNKDLIINENDELILFELKQGSYKIKDINLKNVSDRTSKKAEKEVKGNLLIFGYNVLLETIIEELPKDVKNITIITKEIEKAKRINNKNNFNINIIDTDDYESILDDTKHIILLVDRSANKDNADVNNILLLLKLIDYRDINNLSYNIAVELNMENSRRVSIKDSRVDYVVVSNIASLILAQMSENNELKPVFEELLSRKGNELYSKPLNLFNLGTEHDYSYSGLKQIVLSYGYVLLGYIQNNTMSLDSDLKDRIQFNENDRLIVLGKD